MSVRTRPGLHRPGVDSLPTVAGIRRRLFELPVTIRILLGRRHHSNAPPWGNICRRQLGRVRRRLELWRRCRRPNLNPKCLIVTLPRQQSNSLDLLTHRFFRSPSDGNSPYFSHRGGAWCSFCVSCSITIFLSLRGTTRKPYGVTLSSPFAVW